MRDALRHTALPSSVKDAFIGYVPSSSRSALRGFCSLFAASALAGACGNESVDDLFRSDDHLKYLLLPSAPDIRVCPTSNHNLGLILFFVR